MINVTIYDLLLDCYLTVTTAIGTSGRTSRIDTGRRGSLITFRSTVTTPKWPFRTAGRKYNSSGSVVAAARSAQCNVRCGRRVRTIEKDRNGNRPTARCLSCPGLKAYCAAMPTEALLPRRPNNSRSADKRKSPAMATSRGSSIAQWLDR